MSVATSDQVKAAVAKQVDLEHAHMYRLIETAERYHPDSAHKAVAQLFVIFTKERYDLVATLLQGKNVQPS